MDITFVLSQSPTATATQTLSASAYTTQAASSTASSGGDTVSISDEGKALAAGMTQSYQIESEESEESEDSSSTSSVETLKKLIEQLEQEIEEIEESDMPEKEKENKLSALRTELAQVQLEYAQALQEESGTVGSTLLSGLGSEAEGFANSLT